MSSIRGKKRKKAKKEQNGFFHPLLALQGLKEKAACPKGLSTKILLQRKTRKGVRNDIM